MDIRFLPAELAVGRTFSFASSPTEGALRILFRSGVTPFKRRLQTVEPGDIALITQYGVNELRFERAPAVLIAGGVGIAPFRSIVKRAVDCGDPLDATLIYVDRSDTDFPFQDELRIWSREVPGFRSEFVATARDGRLTASTLRRLIGSPSPHEQVFYLAGPPAMVTATEALLADLGVARNQIRADPFEGY